MADMADMVWVEWLVPVPLPRLERLIAGDDVYLLGTQGRSVEVMAASGNRHERDIGVFYHRKACF